MFYTHPVSEERYMLNLLDTPGHVDFSSELLRSLLPSQGALLLVDAAQGVQAQTLTVLDEAQKRNLTVVGAGSFCLSLLLLSCSSLYFLSAVNKWDLVKDDGRGEAAVSELSDLLGCRPDEILRISAKTGLGVEGVLEAMVERIPPPPPVKVGEKLRALAFDSWYDSFRGVVSLVAVFEGEIKKGTPVLSPPLLSLATNLDSPFSHSFLQAIPSPQQQPASPTPSWTSAPSPLAKSPSPNTLIRRADACGREWSDG
jgi:translation elongation factor EF-4